MNCVRDPCDPLPTRPAAQPMAIQRPPSVSVIRWKRHRTIKSARPPARPNTTHPPYGTAAMRVMEVEAGSPTVIASLKGTTPDRRFCASRVQSAGYRFGAQIIPSGAGAYSAA